MLALHPLVWAWCAGLAASGGYNYNYGDGGSGSGSGSESGDCYNSEVLKFGATLMFGFELIVSEAETGLSGGVTVDMEPERDTDTFRQKAYDWLYDEYGLEFDASVQGFQMAANAAVFVIAQAAHPSLYYPVMAFDDSLMASPFPRQHRFFASDVELDHAVYLVLPQAATATWTNANPASATFNTEYEMVNEKHVISYGSYRVVVRGEPVTDESTDLFFHTTAGELHHLSEQGTIIEEQMETAWWGEGKLMGFQTMRVLDPDNPDLQELRSRNVMTFNTPPPAGTGCLDVTAEDGGADEAPNGFDRAKPMWRRRPRGGHGGW